MVLARERSLEGIVHGVVRVEYDCGIIRASIEYE